MSVSMESGLEDRNNSRQHTPVMESRAGLNGVRPRRPEQCPAEPDVPTAELHVSMESGLEDRNNSPTRGVHHESL